MDALGARLRSRRGSQRVNRRCEKCGHLARAAVSFGGAVLVAACTVCGNASAVQHAAVPFEAYRGPAATAAYRPVAAASAVPALAAGDESLHTSQEYDPGHVGGAEFSNGGTAVTTPPPIVQPLRRPIRAPYIRAPRGRIFGPPLP
jgi:hypothetical protein